MRSLKLHKQITERQKDQTTNQKVSGKKAMSEFEVIGFAILALVVIIVCIVIFTKLAGGPANTIGAFSNNENANTNNCITNPSTCNPLQQNAAPTTGSSGSQPAAKTG